MSVFENNDCESLKFPYSKVSIQIYAKKEMKKYLYEKAEAEKVIDGIKRKIIKKYYTRSISSRTNFQRQKEEIEVSGI